MNWFKKIFGFIGSFFKRAAVTALGAIVNELEDVAVDIVRAVEESHGDLPGEAKFDIVFNELKNRYPSARSAALNLAIELAVAIVKDIFEKQN